MKGESADVAANFVKSYVKDMVDEKIGLEKLIISKSLNGFYKNPDSIAHKVLGQSTYKSQQVSCKSVASQLSLNTVILCFASDQKWKKEENVKRILTETRW